MPRQLKFLLVGFFLLLYACSAKRAPPPEDLPELVLLSPTDITHELVLRQAAIFETSGEQQAFIAITRIEFGRVRMALLLPTGQSMLDLDYNGIELFQQDFSGRDLPGRDILASLQFALWPEASLQKHYRQLHGWRLKLTEDSRSLLTDAGVLLRIDRSNQGLIVNNYLHQYRVSIQTLKASEL